MIRPERLHVANDKPTRDGAYVLYWMQASQRAEWNHALAYAISAANDLGKPVLVVFGLTDDYPEANERHYAFLLEGLAETAHRLRDRGVGFVLRGGHPPDVAAEVARDACLLVADMGYLRHQVLWRAGLAEAVDCRMVVVESDLVVPVETASGKEEYAARTIRPKLQRHWPTFLVPMTSPEPVVDGTALGLEGQDVSDVEGLLAALDVDRDVPRVTWHHRGGRSRAMGRLEAFLAEKLADYADRRNDPSLDIQSHMSPYLHFGQVSPLEVALAVQDADAPAAAKESYLEELLVRRELSANFVYYCDAYDRYEAVPSWARDSLAAHADDERPHVYTRAELANSRTHDPYWNAAMTEMRLTGKMHNYMRMYWGKKILEWTRTPETAFRWMLEMNNRCFLDGRDPASYTNVAWCFGKHDRPWQERAVFGKVRYMNARGLERKFDIDAYVEQVARLGDEAE